MNIVNEIKKADEKTLIMSKKHCHLKNVTSIVYKVNNIKNGNSSLERVFLAEEGHALADNFPSMGMTVGIHNHKYNLYIQCIYGILINDIYSDVLSTRCSVKMNKFDFQLNKKTLEKKFTKIAENYLSVVRTEFVSDSIYSYLRADELHTVRCKGKTAWKVIERDYINDFTVMFSDKNEDEINKEIEGLYVPFSCKDEVVSYVEKFFN